MVAAEPGAAATPVSDAAAAPGPPAPSWRAGRAPAWLLWGIPVLLFLLAFLAFAGSPHARGGFPLDDAWIHRVYARALARGEGFAYNPGQPEAGATSPLWAIVTAPAHWLGDGEDLLPIVAVKAIGALFALACVLLVGRLTAGLTGSVWAGAGAAAIFALEPRLHFSALAGMETLLLVFLLLAAVVVLCEDRDPRLFLALLGLAPLARPEALVLLPAALVGIVSGWRRWTGWGARLALVALPLLPMTLWSGFCRAAIGRWLPTTFYLKAHAFALDRPALELAWAAVRREGWGATPLLGLGLIAFILAGWTLPWRRGVGVVGGLLGVSCLYMFSVVGSRPINLDGYYWTRWLDPGSLLFTAAMAVGIGWLLAAGRVDDPAACGREVGWGEVLGLALVVAGLFVAVAPLARSFADRRSRLASDCRAIEIMNAAMGRWIAAHTPADAVVAVNDAGAIRYLGQRRTLDLIGLNYAAVAFGRLDQRRVLAQADWLAIFPAWFAANGLLPQIMAEFVPRFQVRIPLAEYTVCNAPGQIWAVAWERRVRPPP